MLSKYCRRNSLVFNLHRFLATDCAIIIVTCPREMERKFFKGNIVI